MQADWQTTLLNYTSGEETRLPNITIAQKTYPASGATAMLPQTGASLDSSTGLGTMSEEEESLGE